MTIPRRFFTLLLGALLAVPCLAGDEPTLEQRLERLCADLERARLETHVPGMSLAVVLDDELVLARGFGLADVEGERPAEADTIYAVGSTTKAFTAALVGMLVDEGKLGWDDPVSKYLPYFELRVRSEDPNARCTLRDLLSHRHGFSRMGLLWVGNGISREKILRTAAGAEPWDDFRKGFHYCNVTYLAAGEAAGVAAESTWDEMIAERIFEPLGMDSTTLTVAEAEKDPHLALGYQWLDSVGELEREPFVPLDSIGPAGSINSNVLDMAQWVRMQLGEGEVDDLRLISASSLRETWSSQIAMGPGVGYGMGWMLREHDGRRVVEHGGNIAGFSAEVGMIPSEHLGYVLLMNLSAAPLQQASLGIVFDALLGEWPEEDLAVPGPSADVDYEEYVGTYVANFASFRDEEFQVLAEDGHLALDIPSQQTFALKDPDAEGKWQFALTDQVEVSFNRDDAGRIVSLTIHQSGFGFEVPRQGIEVEPEVPLAQLEPYTGKYVREEGGRQVEVGIEGGRLVLLDRGNKLPFETPDEEGWAPLRARADQGATFERDGEGNVVAFVFRGEAGDKLFTRAGDVGGDELPSLEDVLALRRPDERTKALEAAGGVRVTGEVLVPQAGLKGALTVRYDPRGRFANVLDFGEFGRVEVVVADGQAWAYNPMKGTDDLRGDQLEQALLSHPAAVDGDWREYFDSVSVLREDTLDERPVHVLRLEKGGLPPRTYWVDAENGDVLRVDSILMEGPVRVPTTTTYSGFREVDGIRRATRATSENPASGRMVMLFEEFESGLELGDEVFQAPTSTER